MQHVTAQTQNGNNVAIFIHGTDSFAISDQDWLYVMWHARCDTPRKQWIFTTSDVIVDVIFISNCCVNMCTGKCDLYWATLCFVFAMER